MFPYKNVFVQMKRMDALPLRPMSVNVQGVPQRHISSIYA